MKKMVKASALLLSILFSCSIFADSDYLISKEQLQAKTPDEALARLKAGNERFVKGNLKQLDLMQMVKDSKRAQHPGAVVLSCIDSRVPVEIVFDQGVGNVFVARTAGNVLSDDTIAGLEFATKVVGSKLIVVMGHEDCGAVAAACKGVKLGHITELLAKIQPAVDTVKKEDPKGSCKSEEFVDKITGTNAQSVAKQVLAQSPIIAKLVADGQIKIVSAMYHTDTGKVEFYE
jgi:carbonic anhydrase